MENKDFMHHWFNELWNKGNENVMDEMLHPQVEAHGLDPSGAPLVGVDAFKKFYYDFRNQLDYIKVNIIKTVTENDNIVALCEVQAKHKQTGNEVKFTGTSVAELEDGKLKKTWNNFDFLSFHIQTGKINPEQLA